MPPETTPPPAEKKRLSIALDFRTVLIVLLVVALGVMAFLWKPWQANIKASDRTVTVTGDATLTAEPDEYVFSPTYEFKNSDKQAALDAMSKKSDEVVAKLKALGVADKKIQTNSSGNNNGIYFPTYDQDGTTIYTLSLTVTISDRTLAQKVQDYLVSTAPTGAVSPQANFSDAKTKSLQTQARDAATKDAHSKADQSAKNLGFKISKVKSVDDGSGFHGPVPYLQSGTANRLQIKDTASPALSVQPGENKLQYSVTVVYYIH